MHLYHLRVRQNLPLTLQQAWDFFSNPNNLAEITPAWLNFSVTSSLPEKMHPGMIVTYQVRPWGSLALNWVTEITHVHAPHFFVDEQRDGPYRFWHHQHHFREVNGGVEMTDVVHYALPFGPLGRLAHYFSVETRLREIFKFRKECLNKIFNSATSAF